MNFGKMKEIRIGCYSAFWGDSAIAVKQFLEPPELHVDYVVADYLAELTMGLLARSARGTVSAKNKGYISEFLELVLAPYLDLIIEKRVKFITNAGGLDPAGLRDAIISHLEKRGLSGRITVAAVTGDDLLERKDQLLREGAFKRFDPLSGLGVEEEGIEDTKNLLSLNAYLGAEPITEALRHGADIVVTGRCVDSALVVGPLAFEFGWRYDTNPKSLDLLASASLAGHVIECGCQATGGNYTDWRVSAASPYGGWTNMGYPILTFTSDNKFTISKPERTGGIVDTRSVSEQMLYEVLDPENYVLPDVVVDMSQVHLRQVAPNVVLVEGAKGKPPTPWLKCTAVEQRGHRLTVDILVCGEEAESKAQVLGRAIIDRTNAIATTRYQGTTPIPPEDSEIILIGAENSLNLPKNKTERKEIALRVAVRHLNRAVLDILAKESAPFLTNSCPGICMLTSGRPKTSPNFVSRSVLVDRSAVQPEVQFALGRSSTRIPLFTRGCHPATATTSSVMTAQRPPRASTVAGKFRKVRLLDIAVGRSGDKGDTANVAIIARDPKYYHHILEQVTPEVLFSAFEHFIAPGGTVTRFTVPGLFAVNFVLTKALGGGGLSSLKLDRQAKSYAQIALSKIMISLPDEVEIVARL